MTWFTLPPAMPMQFSTTCLGPCCKKKRGDPGVHGHVRCVPQIMSGGPQQDHSVATLEWMCVDSRPMDRLYHL